MCRQLHRRVGVLPPRRECRGEERSVGQMHSSLAAAAALSNKTARNTNRDAMTCMTISTGASGTPVCGKDGGGGSCDGEGGTTCEGGICGGGGCVSANGACGMCAANDMCAAGLAHAVVRSSTPTRSESIRIDPGSAPEGPRTSLHINQSTRIDPGSTTDRSGFGPKPTPDRALTSNRPCRARPHFGCTLPPGLGLEMGPSWRRRQLGGFPRGRSLQSRASGRRRHKVSGGQNSSMAQEHYHQPRNP